MKIIMYYLQKQSCNYLTWYAGKNDDLKNTHPTFCDMKTTPACFIWKLINWPPGELPEFASEKEIVLKTLDEMPPSSNNMLVVIQYIIYLNCAIAIFFHDDLARNKSMPFFFSFLNIRYFCLSLAIRTLFAVLALSQRARNEHEHFPKGVISSHRKHYKSFSKFGRPTNFNMDISICIVLHHFFSFVFSGRDTPPLLLYFLENILNIVDVLRFPCLWAVIFLFQNKKFRRILHKRKGKSVFISDKKLCWSSDIGCRIS